MARNLMLTAVVGGILAACLLTLTTGAAPDAPVLINSDFECEAGYHPQPGIIGMVPNGWTALLLQGNPSLNSWRMETYQECTREDDDKARKLNGHDSYIYKSEDIETTPEPGKPFDALIYQQVPVTPGVAYSLSGWMVSFCGGTAEDCPPGYYMAKMIGLDPTGGIDPQASSTVWIEDRRNATETAGWLNLRVAARAQGPDLTVFARIRSPFRWYGNHAYADAFSLVRAPTAQIVGLPASQPGRSVEVRWQGDLGPDIPAIPNGIYSLLFDVQYRAEPAGAWTDWLTGQPAGSAVFHAPVCGGTTYAFRVRPRAEQLVSGGAWPNHRYPGVWSDPATVTLGPGAACNARVYLPALLR